ncbi:MAG: TonB-dependent receptor [Sphingobium sp.]
MIPAAHASDGDSPKRDTPPAVDGTAEIIVSARRRDEILTNVPASVTAYSSDFIKKQNIQSFADYATRIPNLTFQYGQGSDFSAAGFSGGRVTIIRGVAGANTTAYYINDTPIPASVSPLTLGLERIEILKGPQGTLFGASSMGGNLRFITRKPSLSDNSYIAQGQAGATRRGKGADLAGSAYADIVLVPDQLGINASVEARRDSGFISRTFPDGSGNLVSKDGQGENKTLAGSINIRMRFSDSLEATVSGMGQISNMHGLPAAYVPLPAYKPVSYTLDRSRDVQEYSKDQWGLASFVLNYSGDGFGIVSSTSYFSRHVNEKEDGTEGQNSSIEAPAELGGFGVDLGEATFYNIDKAHERRFTQETRLTFDDGAILPGISGVVGVFYQKQTMSVETPRISVPELAALPGIFGTDYVIALKKITHERNIAAFGEIYAKLTPKLTLTLGARAYDIKQGVDPWFSYGIYSPPEGSPRPAAHNTQSGVVPKAVLSYEIGDRGNVYASASKGFRVGGTQRIPDFCANDLAGLGLTQADVATYKPDTVWSYEVGAKSRLASGRMSASVAAFQIDWAGIQQTVLMPVCGFAFQSNAGKARIRGGEFELSGRPFAGVPLNIQLGFGYADAILRDPGLTDQAPNSRLTQVPKFTGTASAYYEQPISGSTSWFAAADYSYTGSVKITNGMGGFLRRQPFNMVNANIGLRFGNSQIMIFGKNLLDKRLNMGDLYPIGLDRLELLPDGSSQRLPRAAVSRPLQVGVQYRVSF